MEYQRSFRCPLCDSVLTKARYMQIVGVWEERKQLEDSLRKQLAELRGQRRALAAERKRLVRQMERDKRAAIREGVTRGIEKERKRAERLSRMIQGQTNTIQTLSRRIKELEEQLKRGTTPSIEGLNLEKKIVEELRREFPSDHIEHHGKAGDILHKVYYDREHVGSIVYEVKLQQRYSGKWIEQTRRAVTTRNATYGILVTAVSKRGTAGFWMERDVVVVHPFGVIYVAKLLREAIVELKTTTVSASEADKRAKALMTYMRSDEFMVQMRDCIHRTRKLVESLGKEIRLHRDTWRERFHHYDALHGNIAIFDLRTKAILRGLSPTQALRQQPPKGLPSPIERYGLE